MKVLALLLVLVATATCQRGSELTAFLKEIPQHASFQRLDAEEQLLFAELVIAAEDSKAELQAFIDRVGLLQVIQLVDHLSDSDAHRFATYLAEHMGYDTGSNEWGHLQNWVHDRQHWVGKRDSEPDEDLHWNNFYGILHDMEHDGYFRHLPHPERETLEGLMKAANDRAVNEYIQSVGYGAIFGLLNAINASHAHEIYTFLEIGLQLTTPAPTATN